MNLARSSFAALCATGLAAVAPHPALAQAQATFGDWSAACDNTRVCRAIGFAAETAGGGWIRIDRDAAPSAPATMRIVIDLETTDKELPLALKFDDESVENPLGAQLTIKVGEDGRFGLDIPAAAQPLFLQAMRKASKLTLKRLNGKFEGESDELALSLKGSVAAIRWLDDQQKRAGTTTALIASGPAPAATMPPAPAEPRIRGSTYKGRDLGDNAPEPVVRAWKTACDELDDDNLPKGEGFEIGPQTQLWMMPCSRGAYNFSSMAFLMRGREAPQLLKFEGWRSAENWRDQRFVTEGEELVNPEFSLDSMQISFFAKGRGIGDCGSAGNYTWDGQRFRLTGYISMGECKGVSLDDWPTLWRAKVIR